MIKSILPISHDKINLLEYCGPVHIVVDVGGEYEIETHHNWTLQYNPPKPLFRKNPNKEQTGSWIIFVHDGALEHNDYDLESCFTSLDKANLFSNKGN